MNVRRATGGGNTGAGVVVHFDEGEHVKHETVVRNVKNLLDDFDGDLQVELVTHGPGIGLCLLIPMNPDAHSDRIRTAVPMESGHGAPEAA